FRAKREIFLAHCTRATEASRFLTSLVDHLPRWDSALRIGRLDIWINPSKGGSSSRIRKIAPDTDTAASNSAAIAMELDGANKPQLKKMIASHAITTISRGMAIALPDCSNNNQRNWPRSLATPTAWDLSETCTSLRGANVWMALCTSSAPDPIGSSCALWDLSSGHMRLSEPSTMRRSTARVSADSGP